MQEVDLFDLDETRLDKEWLEQARIYYQHATKLADARRDHEQAKAVKELVEAEVDEDIRLYPEKYNLEKLTETRVEKAIIRSARYQEAYKKLIIAKHKMDTLQALVEALDHRKKALEKRTDLWIHEWHAEPKLPQASQKELSNIKSDIAFGKRKNRSDD